MPSFERVSNILKPLLESLEPIRCLNESSIIRYLSKLIASCFTLYPTADPDSEDDLPRAVYLLYLLRLTVLAFDSLSAQAILHELFTMDNMVDEENRSLGVLRTRFGLQWEALLPASCPPCAAAGFKLLLCFSQGFANTQHGTLHEWLTFLPSLRAPSFLGHSSGHPVRSDMVSCSTPESSVVPSLRELCRGAIWNAIISLPARSNAKVATERSLSQNFRQLPLPPILIRYIAFE